MRWRVEDTPERAAFREQFRRWVKDNVPPGWMEAVEAGDEARFAEIREGWQWLEFHARLGGSGYAAPLWPKEYGGLGGEVWHQQVIREELTRYRLPTFHFNILGIGLAGPTIIAHGTDEQKRRFLPRILTGENIWCQLFSEPGSGSDLASLSTRASRDGDSWIVNGQKVWTSIAQFAHLGMLVARTDPDAPKHEGITYLVLDMKAPGVEVRPLRQMTGGSEFNEVYLTDVRIPDAHRIGEAGDGWRVARTTLMNERVTLGGLSFDPALVRGGTRADSWRAFLDGVPDRADPLVRQHIAQLYIEQEIKEINTFRANWARLRGEQPGPEGAINKVFGAELNQRRTAFAMTAAGMHAVAWAPGDQSAENRVYAFLRARANTIEGGTSEILRNQMAERMLGLPRDAEVDKGVAWKDLRRN